MQEAARFYWLWLRGTVWKAPGAADSYAGLVGTVTGLAAHYRPGVEQMTSGWIWQVPLWAFGAVLMLRFLATPFALWRQGDVDLQRYRAKLAPVVKGRTLPLDMWKTLPAGLIEASGPLWMSPPSMCVLKVLIEPLLSNFPRTSSSSSRTCGM